MVPTPASLIGVLGAQPLWPVRGAGLSVGQGLRIRSSAMAVATDALSDSVDEAMGMVTSRSHC